MNVKNLMGRIVTCVVGLPLVFSVIFLLPQCNRLAFCAMVCLMSAIGSLEMSRLVFGRTRAIFAFSTILPASSYIQSLTGIQGLTEACLAVLLLVAFGVQIICTDGEDFSGKIDEAAKCGLTIAYPAYLASFVVRMATLDGMTEAGIGLFLALVFGNDMFAYICGMLFGKKSQGIVKASPHKSLAGFAGGHVFSVVCCICFFTAFRSSLPDVSIYFQIPLALAVSFLANVGDLVESVFKRSAGVKDSGRIIPGRGGMLDCLDSIVFSAPAFWLFMELALGAAA